MKKTILIAALAVLLMAYGGFYVGLMPGESVDYHIPGTYFDGRVIYLVGTPTYCTVWVYYRDSSGYHFYNDFDLSRGGTALETQVYPNLYCNPAGTLDAYSNYKVRVYSVHLPTVKTSHQPYVPQLTPYP